MEIARAWLCLTALVTASWAIRYRCVATVLSLTAIAPRLRNRHWMLEAVAGGFGQFFQGRRQTLCFQPDGEEAARQLAGLGDGLVQQAGDSRGHVLRSGRRAGQQVAVQRVGVEGQAHQLLAKSVVNVLADAGLLAVADLQELALEAVALGFRPDARNGARRLGGDRLNDDAGLASESRRWCETPG